MGNRLVSIIVPTYREASLAESLAQLVDHLASGPGLADVRFEVLVVDDSPDDERERLGAALGTLGAPNVVVKLVLGSRKGKGAAIGVGALASAGDFVLTMDADLPVPLSNIVDFLGLLDDGADIVIGERPSDRNLSEPVRFVLSRALFLLQRAFVFNSSEFLDTQCGFKAFRGDVIRALARAQIVDGGMYDIEYLYAARKAGLRIDKRPVVSRPESRPSKIKVGRAAFTDPRDLVRIKARGVTGGYRSVSKR